MPAKRATLEPQVFQHHQPCWNQKTMILDKILAEEIHKTFGKILTGDDHGATARPLSGPRQDP